MLVSSKRHWHPDKLVANFCAKSGIHSMNVEAHWPIRGQHLLIWPIGSEMWSPVWGDTPNNYCFIYFCFMIGGGFEHPPDFYRCDHWKSLPVIRDLDKKWVATFDDQYCISQGVLIKFVQLYFPTSHLSMIGAGGDDASHSKRILRLRYLLHNNQL